MLIMKKGTDRDNIFLQSRKLESEYTQLDTLEGKQSELEAILKAEGRRLVDSDRDVKELEKAQFQHSQQLFKERGREKDLIATISGGQAQNRNMISKIQQLDEQVSCLKVRMVLSITQCA